MFGCLLCETLKRVDSRSLRCVIRHRSIISLPDVLSLGDPLAIAVYACLLSSIELVSIVTWRRKPIDYRLKDGLPVFFRFRICWPTASISWALRGYVIEILNEPSEMIMRREMIGSMVEILEIDFSSELDDRCALSDVLLPIHTRPQGSNFS